MNIKVINTINNNITKLVLLSTMITILFCSFTSNAGNKEAHAEIYYKSTTIQSGDTLWDLSHELSKSIDIPTKDVVELIMKINDLSNDLIYNGDILIVPYMK